MNKDEALRLALEALVKTDTEPGSKAWERETEAITAIKKALAQPVATSDTLQKPVDETAKQRHEPKPVVWMYVNKSTHETFFQRTMRSFVDHGNWSEVPLYGEPLANHELQCVCGAVWCGDEMVHLPNKTSPPKREPLTDDQWQVMADTLDCFITRSQKDIIEAALGIKENT